MKFDYSVKHIPSSERPVQRLLEIIPGATSWLILISLLILSLCKPVWAAILLIAFLLYWILRVLYLTLFLLMAYVRLASEKHTDWMRRVRQVALLETEADREKITLEAGAWQRWISERAYQAELNRFRLSGSKVPLYENLLHLVIIPVAKESAAVLEPGMRSLAEGAFPSSKMLVVIALEERASAEVKQGAQHMLTRYAGHFYDFRIVEHPDGLAGEARVKGANVSYAGREMLRYFEDKRIPLENVIVSCFDADTVVGSDYFACLTYQYLVQPDRERCSFQPIPVYHNNIWQAPWFSRILEMGASFFQMIEATNPEKLVTFSSHSMSFKALAEIGFWPRDMISDDSSIFWKAYIHFDGRYRVVPLYVTLSMDVVDAGSWWKTAVNVYKQKRRWAWGVENFPVVMRAFMKSKTISLYHQWRLAFKLFEGHVSWATWAFIPAVFGLITAFSSGREFSRTVIYYSAPRIAGIIFNLSLGALIVAIVLSFLILPKRKAKRPWYKKIIFILQWLLLPWVFMFLGALPALDAQTRLMLGRYMEFWVTEKARKEG